MSTLLLPLGFTAVAYLRGLVDPFGDVGSLAYTQYGNLPLLQVLSITGTSGIVFVMAWFASICNWMWEQHFSWKRIRAGALLYSGILALIFIGGSIRLLLPSQAPTVRVASLGVPQSLISQVLPTLSAFNLGKTTQVNLNAMHTGSFTLTNDLLSRTRREASAGAKIVAWPECGTFVLQMDESELLTRASAVARQSGIYLNMGVCVFDKQILPKVRDEAILIDPHGNMVWRYEKAHPVEGMEDVIQGDGKVPVVSTQYGRLANVICFDEDFPALLQQTGQARTDILLAPSNDWKEIDPWHTHAATYRAIENGFSLVRQTNNGLSLAVDDKGRTLASVDYFSTDDQTMVAFVPVRGEQTIYAHIGDTFAWLCIAGLLALSLAMLIRRQKASSI
ncbi:apolipoprotein N-acyltransferase [Ktedonobacter robiniae]|uniref:Apolipoprotein N-acyltransferase n=2 Tax=Ktedonobacter robiniae TaxID=2778365 RepID=A0ABQ3V1S3_9CHLR|nr:apolipoprotein N-acyltransferase [Ktedonobacter robiniae]